MAESSEHFNKIAKEWDDDSFRTQLAKNIALSIRKNGNIRGDKLLDFGCGTGLISFMLADLMENITGWDSSTGMVEQFNKKAKDLEIQAHAQLFDPGKDSFPEEEFDTVVSGMVFHHIEDIPSLLSNLWKSLKPGATLAVADLEKEDGTFHPPEIKGVYHHGFEPEEMKNRFQEAGFTDSKIFPVMEIERSGKKFHIFLITAVKPK